MKTDDEERDAVVRDVIDFIYDISPVWPDSVPREELLRLYRAWCEAEG